MSERWTIAGVAIAIGSYGFAFGVLARTAGLSPLAVLALSALAYSGGAQAAFVSTLASGTAAGALVSGTLVNTRLAIYGALAGRLLRDRHPITRLVGVHLASDETIALTAGAADDRKQPVYWASGLTFFATWLVSTVAGATIGSAITDPDALGLDAAFPAVFIALLLTMVDDNGTRIAVVTAAASTVALTPLLPTGLPILVAALAGLIAAQLLTRVER